jgi:protein FAM98B
MDTLICNQSPFSNISVADMLAARTDLTVIKKVSSDPPDTRTANPLTKIKVGRVPDRGGRPSETAAPPKEMPSWQQRTGQAHDPRNPGGNRGGHRGGGGQHGGGGEGRNKNRGVQGAGWKK